MAVALLTKEEFTSLYKYGHVQLNPHRICDKEGFIEAIKHVLSASDSFEFAQERLIVNTATIVGFVLHLKDLLSIHTLDQQSKSLFETQFHKNLVFGEPIPEDIFTDWYQDVLIERDTIDGIHAFRTICGLPEEKNEDFVKGIVKGRIHRKSYKYFDVPIEERGIWDMLVAYDRYGHYGNESKGHLLDLLDVLIYSTQKKEKYLGYSDTAIENQSIYGKIDGLTGRNFAELIEGLKTTEGTEKFIASATGAYGDIRIPISFLFLKEQFRKEDDWGKLKPIVDKARDFCQEQFGPVVSLIGGFFGYDRFYNDYYEALNLAVLKSSTAKNKVIESIENRPEDLSAPDTKPAEKASDQPTDMAIEEGLPSQPKDDVKSDDKSSITGLFSEQITGDLIYAAYSSVVTDKGKLDELQKYLSNSSNVEYVIDILRSDDRNEFRSITKCTPKQLQKILKKINR